MDALDRVIFNQTDGGKRIGTARDHILPLRNKQFDSLLEWYRAQAKGRGYRMSNGIAGEVSAVINHGRWIVHCPFCAGAEDALPEEPIFWCLSCGMADNENKMMTVIFPETRAEIEAALLKRSIENRNWVVGETVEDLLADNKAHGVK